MTKLKILHRVRGKGRLLAVCQCACGNVITVRNSRLVREGKPRTCGCEFSSERQWQTAKSSYLSWKNMKARCYNPKATGYKNYGGRGITVCKRWRQSFRAFLEDMGQRPEGTTLDRKNNDGNYTKRNCRWATPTEQRLNQRNKTD